MKFLIEEKVPFVRGVFEPFAEVCYLAANDINAKELEDADALITRTRPKLNSENLTDSKIKIIATATIGTDHIDLDFCKKKDIKVVNAPGCNAPGVAQWVFASLAHLNKFNVTGKRLAVIGVGNVGKIVASWGKSLGYKVVEVDPPRAKAERLNNFVSLEEAVKEADIITFHTPLTTDGDFPTYHLANDEFFSKLTRKPVILNAARGAVVDTDALKNALHTGKVANAIIDCWEHEPLIDRELLDMSLVATPHIAGYSLEGKIRASIAAVNAVADFFGLKVDSRDIIPMDGGGNQIEIHNTPGSDITLEAITGTYSPVSDTEMLKRNPDKFEFYRDNYSYRREPAL